MSSIRITHIVIILLVVWVGNTTVDGYRIDEGECGKQDIEPVFPEGRIVNGRAAVLNSWPWQASLYGVFIVSETIYWYLCGGAVINRMWVITAAHCFFFPESMLLVEWMIHVGEQFKDYVGDTVQVKRVENVIIHEKFKFPEYENDIALVKLKEPLTFGINVRPICLPAVEKEVSEMVSCVVSGFAHNENKIIPKHAPLHQLVTPVISRENCSAKEFYGGRITERMVCSGYVGGFSDTCEGDSGRPLMCFVDGKWHAQGLLSYGDKSCGRPRKPTVFTRISFFLPWIREKIHQRA